MGRPRVLALASLVLACASPTEAPGAEIPPSAECVQCHAEDYARADHPPHAGVRPDTCGVCHTESAWHPDVLHHEWELTGAHASEDTRCFDCHLGTPPVYEETPDQCVDCHRDDERGAFDAHHGFGTECASCHTTTAWRPAAHPVEPDAGPPDLGPMDAGAPDAGRPSDAGAHARARRDAGRRAPRTPRTTTTPPRATTVETPPDTTTRASRRY